MVKAGCGKKEILKMYKWFISDSVLQLKSEFSYHLLFQALIFKWRKSKRSKTNDALQLVGLQMRYRKSYI